MTSLAPPMAGALALDLACGQGRHALVLARAGYRVIAMDVSHAALRHLRAAAGAGSAIEMVQADVDSWPFAPEAFDLVVQVDFLERALFPHLEASLRPGGLLLVDTFANLGQPNAEGPSNSAFLVTPGELRAAFSSLEVLRDETTPGETARALFLARKPPER